MRKIWRKIRWVQLKRFAKRESHVLVIAGAIYAGASSFFAVLQPYLQNKFENHHLLAAVVTLFALQRIYGKVGVNT
jgi:hypothetical protein